MRQSFLPLNQLVSQPRDLMNWRQWRAQVFNRLGVSVFSIDRYVSLMEDFETRLVKLVRPRRFQRSPNFKASIFNPTDLQQITWWSTICLMLSVSAATGTESLVDIVSCLWWSFESQTCSTVINLSELYASDLRAKYQALSDFSVSTNYRFKQTLFAHVCYIPISSQV